MSNNFINKITLYCLFFLIFVLPSCSNIPPSDFYEVDGLVSGASTDMPDSPGWEPVQYINSRGLEYSRTGPSKRRPLTFSVYISVPGNYSFWLLAAHPVSGYGEPVIDISITDSDDFFLARTSAEISHSNSLNWIRAGTNTDSNFISFARPGLYRFSVAPREPGNVQIHKFQMSLNNADQPFGLGLPSSKRTDLSAADLFREIPVMLPPSWVFKPMLGLDEKREGSMTESLTGIDEIHRENLGAVWTGAGTDFKPESKIQEKDRIENSVAKGIKFDISDSCTDGTEALFESGYHFIVTQHSPGVGCLERLHQVYQQVMGGDMRSVIFHGIENAYNFKTRQFPAPVTPAYEFEWSAKEQVSGDLYKPGGYRQLIDDLTNPGGSLYNMPFLSMPFDYSIKTPGDTDWDSELFIRTVQLTPFLPVMHQMLPGGPDQLSELEKQQLREAIDLRNDLFTYSYTHAHYTRQTNESIITGFRQYPNQFKYGDAFLVAPVMEPDNDGRIVYFPEGRRWYNYYTGETFEAGRSWFIETQLNRLPLFVKAGSVIPFSSDQDPDRLTIEIYTGDAGAFRMVEDDGETRAYRRAEAARTMYRYNEVEGNLTFTIGAVQAEFDGMSDHRSYDIYFKYTELPSHVELNGEDVRRSSEPNEGYSWRYDESEETLILTLRETSRHEKMDIVIYP